MNKRLETYVVVGVLTFNLVRLGYNYLDFPDNPSKWRPPVKVSVSNSPALYTLQQYQIPPSTELVRPTDVSSGQAWYARWRRG
jgi:hypothetical protein